MSEHIQIGVGAPRVQHVADGDTTVFVYGFPVFTAADLAVYLDDTKQASGFTVNGAGESEGGNVTFDTAPADGVTVTLAREIAIERTSDFQEGGEFRAQVLNDELDYLTAALQQVADSVDRTVALATTDPTNGLVLPEPAARAGRYLAFDGTGQLIAALGSEDTKVVTAFMGTVLDDTDAATARTTLGAQAQDRLLDSIAAEPNSLYSYRNKLINGAMAVDQRGGPHTYVASTLAYALDRWAMRRAGAATGLTVQKVNVAPGGTGLRSSARVQRDSSNSETDSIDFAQAVETQESLALQSNIVVLSFWARKGDDFSAASDVLTSRIATGTGNDQGPAGIMDGAWTGWTKYDKSHTLTAGWQRFTHEAALGSFSQAGVMFRFAPTGTAGAADWYEITGVQLEAVGVSSSQTPFEHRPLGVELTLCRRYYESADEHTTADRFYFRANAGTGNHYFWLPWKVIKRTTPSIALINPGYANGSSGSLVNPAPSGAEVLFNASAIGGYITAGYIADAEL